LSNGKSISIITLTHQQALNAWNFTFNGQEHFVISNAQLICDGKKIFLQVSGKPNISFSVFDTKNELRFSNVRVNKVLKQKRFNVYEFSFKPIKSKINWQLNKELTNAANAMSEDTASNKFYPLYTTTLSTVPKASYYDISFLGAIKKGIVEIVYDGDTQAAYLENHLIADDFNIGLPMTLSLEKFKASTLFQNRKITILITSLTKNNKVYFEPNVFEKGKKSKSSGIKSIIFKPEYKSMITGF
jgi:hypothetical protein